MSTKFVLHNVRRVSGEKNDVIIENGIIKAITQPGQGEGDQLIDCAGAYVSSGWIDLHVHAFPAFEPYGDVIDEIGINQGVTTIVDAGSCGADQIAALLDSAKHQQTNLFAFLNVSRIGLKRVDELADLDLLDREKLMQAIDKHKESIVGLKARISKSVIGENGIKPLQFARTFSHHSGLPLMVHIGSGPPPITEVVSLLEEGDVLTHYLNGKKNNLFTATGEPLQVLQDAIARGVHLDVGHGTASFSFRVAEAARDQHIPFHTISTDIYRNNRLHGPVYSMSHVLTKFLYLGYSLEKVIAAVTVNAADWLGKPELGRIQVGDQANLTLFTVENKSVTITDAEGDSRESEVNIETKGVFIHGKYIAH